MIYLSVFMAGTIKVITKSLTAKCDLDTYILFLLVGLEYLGCTRLMKVIQGVSHSLYIARAVNEPKKILKKLSQTLI